MSDIVADAKAWLEWRPPHRSSQDGRTHSDDCHRVHVDCLIERLVAEVERLARCEQEKAEILNRSSRDDHGLAVTCPASRHAEQIAEELIEHGSCGQLAGEGKHAGRSILSAVRSLYAARAEITRLTAEVERHRMTEEERVAMERARDWMQLSTINLARHTAGALSDYLDRTAPKEA